MAIYAVKQNSDGLIVNTVVWDGVAEWTPPDGHTAVADPNGEGSIGGWHDTSFHPAMPGIDSILPVSGGTAGGTSVTVTGINFDRGTPDVKFDGTSATNVSVASPTSLTCDTPAHAAGAVDVTVENEAGSWTGRNTLEDGFTYTA